LVVTHLLSDATDQVAGARHRPPKVRIDRLAHWHKSVSGYAQYFLREHALERSPHQEPINASMTEAKWQRLLTLGRPIQNRHMSGTTWEEPKYCAHHD